MSISGDYLQLIKEDLILTNQWEVSIPGLTDLLSHTKYLAKTVNIPFWKPEAEGSAASGMKYYKGMNRDLTFSIEFTETVGFTIYNFMKSWQNTIFDKSTMNFHNVPPKKDILVRFFSNKKGAAVIKTYKMVNSIVLDMDDYSLSYDTGEPLLTKVNFQCDIIEEL
jgi:hypothetical protein